MGVVHDTERRTTAGEIVKPCLHLFPGDSVEVGTGRPGYRWVPAYSQAVRGGFSNPLTRKHWRQVAARDNVKLVFHADKSAAMRALTT